MTNQLLLPIGDFAAATSLSAQTLRYYHSKGLLVPAQIDETTGYRAYTFDQVNRALLIVALRRAGVRIRDIRTVLAAPDLLPALITEHNEYVQHRRIQEDAAIAQARQLAEGWPTAEERDRVAVTVVTRGVPGEATGPDGAVLPNRLRAAAEILQRDAIDAGMNTSGPAWCQYALDTPEDRAKVMTQRGADWMVAVDVHDFKGGTLPLPADVELQNSLGRRERVVRLPERPTMVTLAAALDYLTKTSLAQGLIPDLGQPRYVFKQDHVELAVTVEPSEET